MSDSELQTYSLPENLDLDAIDTIRDWLMPALDNGSVTLDGSHVSRVYTNCLMMLLTASGEAIAHGHQLAISNASDAFKDAVASLGLTANFSEIWGD